MILLSLVVATAALAPRKLDDNGTPVDLGTARNFAIISKTGISTVPTSAITGDIGVSPVADTYMTGFFFTLGPNNRLPKSTQFTGTAYSAKATRLRQ